jgi:putative ABC transport system permease protein
VGTAVIYDQLEYIRNKNIGVDKENLIYAPITGDLWSKRHLLKTSLANNSLTSEFAFVSDLPTLISNTTPGVQWEGKDPDTQPLFTHMMMDENALRLFDLTLLAGRNFSGESAADSGNVIVNEAALKTMGMPINDAVGRHITLWGNTGTIVGIVKDFFVIV